MTSLKLSEKLSLVAECIALWDIEQQVRGGELHDGLIQYIVGARMWLNSVQIACQDSSQETRDALEVIQHALDRAVLEARQILVELSGGQSRVGYDSEATGQERIERVICVWSPRLQLRVEPAGPAAMSEPLAVITAFLMQNLLTEASSFWQATHVQIGWVLEDQFDLTIEHDGTRRQSESSEHNAPRMGLVKKLVTLLDGRLESSVDRVGGRRLKISLPAV